MKTTTMRLLFGAFLAAALATVQAAEPAPSVTFGTSATNANGTLATRLTWSTSPAGATCNASGAEDWSGPKEANGTQDLAPITFSGTYTLTLACSWPIDSQARLSWTQPDKNTDGSPLTNLAGYKVYKGTNDQVENLLTTIDSPSTLAYVDQGLTPGTYWYAVSAFNSLGAESTKTGPLSKTVSPASSNQQTVTLTVNPVPGNPANFAVQ